MTAHQVVVAEWLSAYGWVMQFKLTDGPHERIAVDRAEAKRIVNRVLPGATIEWRGPRNAA